MDVNEIMLAVLAGVDAAVGSDSGFTLEQRRQVSAACRKAAIVVAPEHHTHFPAAPIATVKKVAAKRSTTPVRDLALAAIAEMGMELRKSKPSLTPAQARVEAGRTPVGRELLKAYRHRAAGLSLSDFEQQVGPVSKVLANK